jgi:hypothetical protein
MDLTDNGNGQRAKGTAAGKNCRVRQKNTKQNKKAQHEILRLEDRVDQPKMGFAHDYAWVLKVRLSIEIGNSENYQPGTREIFCGFTLCDARNPARRRIGPAGGWVLHRGFHIVGGRWFTTSRGIFKLRLMVRALYFHLFQQGRFP